MCAPLPSRMLSRARVFGEKWGAAYGSWHDANEGIDTFEPFEVLFEEVSPEPCCALAVRRAQPYRVISAEIEKGQINMVTERRAMTDSCATHSHRPTRRTPELH